MFTQSGSLPVRQTFQSSHLHLRYYPIQCFLQSLIQAGILHHHGTRRENRRPCLHPLHGGPLIHRRLFQTDQPFQGYPFLLVARSLSAPRRSIDPYPFIHYPDNRRGCGLFVSGEEWNREEHAQQVVEAGMAGSGIAE